MVTGKTPFFLQLYPFGQLQNLMSVVIVMVSPAMADLGSNIQTPTTNSATTHFKIFEIFTVISPFLNKVELTLLPLATPDRMQQGPNTQP